MVSFVNAISKIFVTRNSRIGEECGENLTKGIGKVLRTAIENGGKVVKQPIKLPKEYLVEGCAGTGKFSVADALSEYVGQTSLNFKSEFDRILKEAKTKGKIKLDVSEIAKYLEGKGMSSEVAQNRAYLLSGLDKLKASGAAELYIPKANINVNKADPVLLSRIDKIL